MKLRIIPLFIALTASLSFVSTAHADPLSLAISPPILQIQALPPAKVTTFITIMNTSNNAVNASVQLRPFTQADLENGQVKFIDKFPGPDQKILQKVRIYLGNQEVTSLDLAPKQQKKLTLLIDIPENEPVSDYYFSVIFISNFSPTDKTNYSQAQGGIATNVLLSIGKGAAQGDISRFSTPFYVESGPVPFTLAIHNSGTHFIAPQGNILVKNMFGQTIGKIDILPVNVLAATTRLIPDASQNSSSASLKTLREKNPQPFIFWPEKFLLGPYQATANITLSNTGPQLTQTTYFFAFPIQAIIITIIILSFITLILIRVKNKVVL